MRNIGIKHMRVMDINKGLTVCLKSIYKKDIISTGEVIYLRKLFRPCCHHKMVYVIPECAL